MNKSPTAASGSQPERSAGSTNASPEVASLPTKPATEKAVLPEPVEIHWETAKRAGAILPTGGGIVFTNSAWKKYIELRIGLAAPSAPTSEPVGQQASEAAQQAAEPVALKFRTGSFCKAPFGNGGSTWATTLTHVGEELPMNPTLYLKPPMLSNREMRKAEAARAHPTTPPACKGDAGECAHNGACLYACGRETPPAAAGEQVDAGLRELLAIQYAGSTLYTDDGELQDCRAQPFIDFKRDTPQAIREAFRARAAIASSIPKGEQPETPAAPQTGDPA